MINIKEKIYHLRNLLSREKFTYEKPVIILIACAVITYILTPNFSSPGVTYRENDIAISDIVVAQDMLIEDVYATNLKRESLVRDMPIYLTYNPNKIPDLIQSLRKSFPEAHNALQKIKTDAESFKDLYINLIDEHAVLHADMGVINRQLDAYDTVRKHLSEKLNEGIRRKYSRAYTDKLRAQIQRTESFIRYYRGQSADINSAIKDNLKRTEEWRRHAVSMDESITARRAKIIRDFSGTYNITLSEEESRQLINSDFSSDYLRLLAEELDKFRGEKIIDEEVLKSFSGNNSLYVYTKKDQAPEINKIYDIAILNDVRTKAVRVLNAENLTQNPDFIRTVEFLLEKLLPANLDPDTQKIADERQRLSSDTEAVYISLKKGYLLSKRGQRLDAKSVYTINKYYEFVSQINIYPRIAGIFLLSCIMFGVVYTIFRRIKLLHNARHKNILMAAIICTFHVVINYAILKVIYSLSLLYPALNVYESGFYALPVVLGSMLASILIGFEGALIITLMCAVFLSLTAEQLGFVGFFYALISGIFSAYVLGKNYSRIDLLVQGMKVSLFNIPLMLVSVLLYDSTKLETQFLILLFSPLLSGIASALFAMFLYPVLEIIFDITTDLKLLELSNMNHPVLKNLMVNAPGSYQHSIMVGTLAEAGAIKIGGNSLLCRVAAYYHDVGKISLPEYFIENISSEMKSGHDRLKDPYKSAEMIINHVHEGIRIAQQNNLGKSIIDIISQHHGTGMVGYFYIKAVEAAVSEGLPASSVDKNQFRYPGPRPKSVESAIVMLADSCEAATRSLNNPTRENIEKIIHKIGRVLLSEGQLDESGISLKDFQNLIKTFTEMLVTIYHKRIEYPELKAVTQNGVHVNGNNVNSSSMQSAAGLSEDYKGDITPDNEDHTPDEPVPV